MQIDYNHIDLFVSQLYYLSVGCLAGYMILKLLKILLVCSICLGLIAAVVFIADWLLA